MMNLFSNPEFLRVYMPVIVQHVMLLMVLSLTAYKVMKAVTWKVAFKKVIAKKMLVWLAVFVVTTILPTIFLTLVIIMSNMLALILIFRWIGQQMSDINSHIGRWINNLTATKLEWANVRFFWESLLKNPTRAIAMVVIIATESGILEMAICMAILIAVSYGINKYQPLSKINWDNINVQRIATIITVVIAIMKVLRCIGMPMWMITIVVVIIAIIIGVRVGFCSSK